MRKSIRIHKFIDPHSNLRVLVSIGNAGFIIISYHIILEFTQYLDIEHAIRL